MKNINTIRGRKASFHFVEKPLVLRSNIFYLFFIFLYMLKYAYCTRAARLSASAKHMNQICHGKTSLYRKVKPTERLKVNAAILPNVFDGTTMFLKYSNMPPAIIISSLTSRTTSMKTGSTPVTVNAITAKTAMSLSASGSRSLPSFVMSFLLLAMYPSRRSVAQATVYTISASSIISKYISTVATGIRKNLAIVIIFGKFIGILLKRLPPLLLFVNIITRIPPFAYGEVLICLMTNF